jgi:hypothetical protein
MARQLLQQGRGKEATAYALEAQKQRQAWAVHQQQEAMTRSAAAAEADRKRSLDYEDWQKRQLVETQDKERGARTSRGDKMADDFRGTEAVKKYQWANTVFRSALEARDTDSAAGDLNLIYAFSSLMDPGSVVREGEMGMVKATQSASEQLRATIDSLNSGKSRLSPEAKAALIDQMGSRYESYRTNHDAYAGQFEGRAKRGGIDPDDVILRTPRVEWTKGQLPVYSGGGTPNAAPPPVSSRDFAPPAPPPGAPSRLRLLPNGQLVPQ